MTHYLLPCYPFTIVTRDTYTQIELYPPCCPPEGFGLYLIVFCWSMLSSTNADKEEGQVHCDGGV